MKLILTGASGFIGRNVLLRAPREWEILALYHQATDFEAFVSRHRLAHVRPVKCNLTDEAEVRAVAAAAGGRADAALYLAANSDPTPSASRPRWDLESNTVALITFLEHCRVGRMVFASSGAVYDGVVGEVTPSTPVDPHLPYAISKLASEQYVRFFAERRRAIDSFVNVRFFGAYGPHEPERKITTRWLRAVMAGQRSFTVRGNGQNLIDFMYVDDAVDAFLALTTAAGYSGTVDLASHAPVSVNDVVQTMARVLGVEVSVAHQGITEEFIQFISVDRTMRQRFGFEPKVSFEDGMRRLHAHFVQQGSGVGQSA
jgi:nucleoside-diphosphate-sugar epimerase